MTVRHIPQPFRSLGVGVGLAALVGLLGCPGSTTPAGPRPGGPRPNGQVVDTAELRLEHTPAIPPRLRARLRQYVSTRRASLMDLSDDGRAMLVATRFGQTSQIHLLTRPGGARQQLTFHAEPVRSARFTPGGQSSVVFLRDVGGSERYQLWRLNRTTGRTTLLTDGKSRHGSFRFSPDGRRLLYTGNGRDGTNMDFYLGDGHSAAAGKLWLPRQGAWYALDWSLDGRQLLIGRYISINQQRLALVDVASRRVTWLTPKSPPAAYRRSVFSPDGKKAYITSDKDGEYVRLYEVDLATRNWRPLTAKLEWNVTRVLRSPDGKHLVFTVNAGGYSALYSVALATGAVSPHKLPVRGIFSGLRFARKAPVLGLTIHGPDLVGDAYTYDLATRKLQRWTHSESGGLDTKRFVRPKLFHYKSFDGRKIPCFGYRPAGAGPHPVILWIHGGPESQTRPYFRALLQYLVLESGVAVLMPNVRGSDGYGKSYLLLDNGFKREDSVRDIGALLDWVGRQPSLDAGRVGVLGGSYGGYMVLAALVRYGARIRAGVEIVGISNFVTFLMNTKPYRRDLRRAEYGDERRPKMRAFLQRISPSTNAHKIRSALFVAQGANDPRVPLSESDQIVKAVRAQGRPVWYMVAKNEGHGFRKQRNRELFYALTALFFQRQLATPKRPPRPRATTPAVR